MDQKGGEVNIDEAKRLVQQVRGVMDNPRRQFVETRLAREYTEACRKVNLRLQQVSMLLQGDDILKSMQLAEAKPRLLDLVAVLNFEGSRNWRVLCDQRGHALPEAFDENQVKRLNEEYAREVDVHHPLYREYRQAEMLGLDVRALRVLRLIHHLEPKDKNASEEAGRLERKISGKRLAVLRDSVETKDHDTVCKLVDELEELEFSLGGDLPLWQKAQGIRIQAGLKKIAKWRDGKEWRDVRDEAAFLDTLKSRFQVSLDKEFMRELTSAAEWAAEQEEAFREDRRFKKTLGDLRHLLNVCEEKYLSVRKRPLAELRNDYDLLSRKWQEIQRYERSLSEDVEDRFEKYYRLLRYQVRQRERMNQLVYAGCAIVFVAIIAVSVKLVQAYQRAGQLVEQLEDQQSKREVVASESFLEIIQVEDGKLVSIPVLRKAVEISTQFILREHTQRDLALEKIDWLIDQAENRFIELSPEQYQQRLAEAEEVLTAIAPDFQGDMSEKIALFRALWDAFLFDEKEARSDRFEKELLTLEEASREKLSASEDVAKVKEGIQIIEGRMPVLDALSNPELEVLKVKEEILFRYEALKQRWTLTKQKVEQWESVVIQLDNPESLNEFVSSLGLYQSNDFADPNQHRKAREITNIRPTNDKMVEALIAFADGKRHAAVKSGQGLKLYPDQFLASERRLLGSLKGDIYLAEVKRFELTDKARKDNDPLKKRPIFVRGALERDRFGRLMGQVYDPSSSADKLKFEEGQFAPADFELLDQGELEELVFFNDSGLSALADGASDDLSASLLGIVDKLHRDRALSPTFRTFVLYRLVQMAEANPYQWGWIWTPSSNGLLKQLKELGADEIKSGDWLVPHRNTIMAEKMKPYYNRASGLGLAQEADFLFEVCERAARDGFEFVGYVDPVKLIPAAISSSEANRVDLWGWSGESKKPALLYRFDADQSAFVPEVEPLAFSPLFIVPSDQEKTIRISADAVGMNEKNMNRSILPRLFLDK
ncbi:hypothetical protein N9B94_00715 [Verrucomicrobia bacterium]|nr:hypothetical protein [Verrucomicrobiota bacterium]